MKRHEEENLNDMACEKTEKYVVTLILAGWWFLVPLVGYDSEKFPADALAGHLLYSLNHGNIWHLSSNLFVFWCLSGRFRLWQDYAIAVLCSFLPVFSFWDVGVTVGFSGILFSEIGIRWGLWCRKCIEAGHSWLTTYWKFGKNVIPWVLVFAVIPHVNWCLHFYCVLTGLLYGRWKS